MKYFSYLQEKEKKRLFYKLPTEFNKNSEISLLRYSIGSLLYIPAINREMLYKFSNKRMKESVSICVCLEDSVGKNGEKEAIKNIDEFLRCIRNEDINKKEIPLIFIRPKNLQQMLKLRNTLEDNLELITGIIIPKANGEIINEFIEMLNIIGCSSLYIMPIIETMEFINITKKNQALVSLYDAITKNADKILNIRVGITDILGYYKVRRNKEFTIYENVIFYGLSIDLISLLGGDEDLDIPISGGVSEFYDMKNRKILNLYIKEIDIDKLNGFIGKTVINPLQMKVVQAKHIVSYEDYRDAESIIMSTESKFGVSASLYGERMNEVNPHLKWAKKIMILSSIYGVFNEGVDYNELLKF